MSIATGLLSEMHKLSEKVQGLITTQKEEFYYVEDSIFHTIYLNKDNKSYDILTQLHYAFKNHVIEVAENLSANEVAYFVTSSLNNCGYAYGEIEASFNMGEIPEEILACMNEYDLDRFYHDNPEKLTEQCKQRYAMSKLLRK